MKLRGQTAAGAVLLVLLAGSTTQASPQAKQPTKKSPSQKSQPIPEQKPDPLELLLRQAQAAVEKKDYQAAIEPLQKYLAERPEDANAHFQLGFLYDNLRRLGEANVEYKKAISLNPKLAEAHYNLGLNLLESDPVAAAESFRRAANLMPDAGQAFYLLGAALENAGRSKEATKAYETAAARDPKNFDIQFTLGRIMLETGRAGEAEERFRHALSLQNDSAQARLGLAESLLSQKKYEAAAAEYQAYLQVEPEEAQVRRQRAAALVELGKLDEALRELDRSDEGWELSPPSLRLRAEIYLQQKKVEEAIAVLQKAIALGPKDAGLHARLGRAYLEKKELAAAEKELRAAVQIDAKWTDALRDLVAVYFLAEQYEATLQVIDLLAKRETLSGGSWYIRGICYDKLGRKEEALAAYQQYLAGAQPRTEREEFQAKGRVKALTKELERRKR